MENRSIGSAATRTVRPAAVLALAGLVAAAAACSSRQVDEEPVIEQGDRVEVPTDDPTASGPDATSAEALAERREAIRAAALAECEGEACDAIARGEVRPGLTETGVLAATGTTGEAWRIRRTGSSVVMTPRSLDHPPTDAVSELVLVQLADGEVARYAYREAQGVQLVDEPADATAEGRAGALADLLVREGDELAAAGELDAALERYDRADVLTRDRPLLDYKIASVLDKQLRPIQALIQYRLFLHRLELEKLRARGEIAANIAEAVSRARDRIIVLEKRTSGEE